jgi:competence protein ComEC
VLVAAHHGSASSSSPAFLALTRPELVILSHGHANRFGMPRAEVLRRYAPGRALSTAACGYLALELADGQARLLASERHRRDRRWHAGAGDDGLENQYDCATQLTAADASPEHGGDRIVDRPERSAVGIAKTIRQP